MRLEDDDVLRLFRLRLADRRRWTLKRLGAEFGVHWMYVQHVLKGEVRAAAHPGHPDRLRCVAAELAGVSAYRERARRLPKAYRYAIRLYRGGHSLRAAAALAGIGHNNLRRQLLAAGDSLRPPGRHSGVCLAKAP